MAFRQAEIAAKREKIPEPYQPRIDSETQLGESFARSAQAAQLPEPAVAATANNPDAPESDTLDDDLNDAGDLGPAALDSISQDHAEAPLGMLDADRPLDIRPPGYVQPMNAPEHHDADEKNGVPAVHEKEREHALDIFEKWRDKLDSGSGGHVGYIAPGSLANAATEKLIRDKKEKDRDAYARALKDQLAAIDAQINALRRENEMLDQNYFAALRRIAEIEERQKQITSDKQALDRYIAEGKVDVDGSGLLKDKLAEQALQDYENRTGRKVDRNDGGTVLQALRSQQEEWNRLEREKQTLIEENTRNREQKAANDQKISDLEEQKQANISEMKKAGVSQQEIDQLMSENVDTWATQQELEGTPGVNRTTEIDMQSGNRDLYESNEDQIASFVRGIAQAKTITDPIEKLRKEKELFDALSQEAKDEIGANDDPELAKFYDAAYFAPLDQPPAAAATLTRTIAPSP